MALDPDFEAKIHKVGASFSFSHFVCNPDEITKILGVTPDKTSRLDEPKPLPGNPNFRTPFSSWQITSQTNSKDTNDHLRDLLNRLEGTERLFASHWGVPTFSILYQATHLSSGNGPFFEAEIIAGIAKFKAELWQDIYALEEAES